MNGLEHTDAALALMQTAQNVTVYDGEAPDDAVPPYAVAYFSTGTATRPRLVPVSERLDLTVQVTSVGYDRAGAQLAADAVRAVFLDSRPAVAGRTSWRITQAASQLPQRDDSVTPHLMYAVDVYAWSTVPAPTAP